MHTLNCVVLIVQYVCVLSCVQFFCDIMDCSLPNSSVHGIFQEKILECAAISYSSGSSLSRGWTHITWISCIGKWILYHLGNLLTDLFWVNRTWNRMGLALASAISISGLPPNMPVSNDHRVLELQWLNFSPEWSSGSSLPGHLLLGERERSWAWLFCLIHAHTLNSQISLVKNYFHDSMWEYFSICFHVNQRDTLRYSRPKEKEIQVLIPLDL